MEVSLHTARRRASNHPPIISLPRVCPPKRHRLPSPRAPLRLRSLTIAKMQAIAFRQSAFRGVAVAPVRRAAVAVSSLVALLWCFRWRSR